MNDNYTSYRSQGVSKSSLGGGGILLLLVLYLFVRPMFIESGNDRPPSPAPDREAIVDPTEGDVLVSGTIETDQVKIEQPAAEVAHPDDDDLGQPRLGQLTDVGNNVMLSSAGLRYTPGSQEGHRLKHVLRHDNDQPSRPGLHGVFDGDADDLFAVIDEAYLLVKQRSPQVQSKREQNRMVHDVNLRRRIGFVGGQEGRRKGNPPATHVRLVLEDDRVITAFPF